MHTLNIADIKAIEVGGVGVVAIKADLPPELATPEGQYAVLAVKHEMQAKLPSGNQNTFDISTNGQYLTILTGPNHDTPVTVKLDLEIPRPNDLTGTQKQWDQYGQKKDAAAVTVQTFERAFFTKLSKFSYHNISLQKVEENTKNEAVEENFGVSIQAPDFKKARLASEGIFAGQYASEMSVQLETMRVEEAVALAQKPIINAKIVAQTPQVAKPVSNALPFSMQETPLGIEFTGLTAIQAGNIQGYYQEAGSAGVHGLQNINAGSLHVTRVSHQGKPTYFNISFGTNDSSARRTMVDYMKSVVNRAGQQQYYTEVQASRADLGILNKESKPSTTTEARGMGPATHPKAFVRSGHPRL